VITFLLRRLAWAVVLLLAITSVTYVIFFVIPTEDSRPSIGRAGSDVDLRTVVEIHGPIYQEYGQYLWRIATQGSLGTSYTARGREVNDMLIEAAPVTASLVVGGLLFALLLAVPVGLLSALRPRSLLDRFGTVFVLVGISAHPIWIGLLLAYVFGYRLEWFPTGGYCEVFSPSTFCGGTAQWAYHLVLPWIAFGLMFAALYMRMVRASVLESLQEEYVRTARAKGAPEWLVMRSHVLRNALLPLVTMIGMDLGIALGGALFVETAFGLPGLGGLAATSLRTRDLPVLLGIVTYTTVAIVVVNLVIDLLYGLIDPRVRLYQRDFEGTVEEQPAPASISGAGGLEPAR
jgi:peptide/nickel transport system permease protein